MWKWIVGILVVVLLFLLIVKPEWLSVFGSIFTDYIQANET